ncbi:carboxypeptidase s1 [Diplodia corticola]|uniref:Carboxypeptidase n=1 Tax=Diplodia corticola TaxID=236234 RepID=A0A1J9RCU3_9PEZI|nr:carboxypeptidase s1 [Diplodia corticola]OJD30331.1 carboxypeptidase s1 [Diplodia corticola]
MLLPRRALLLAAAAAAAAATAAATATAGEHDQQDLVAAGRRGLLKRRQVPADPTGVQEVVSPGGAKVTYKQPGKQGVCETAEGVDDYAGYISLNEKYNVFYWFFEAREDPTGKPLTLWLNGGPGSDSLIGLFQEHGPCNVTEDLKTQWNPYSWNEESNMLYLSQPVGVGFSYETTEVTEDGRYSIVDPDTTNTTYAAAVGAWELIQTFLELSERLDPDISNRTFNLWTESYGGHYGPTFYRYFYEQSEAIKDGSADGYPLQMDSLGIINGIIDEAIQAPYYPEMAVNNTYGIKAVDDTIYSQMKDAYYREGGCADQVAACAAADRTTNEGWTICREATSFCRNEVEEPYYVYGNRGVYDIRHPYDDPTPPDYFVDFLNLASTQEALGVNINYTTTNSRYVNAGFQSTGDFVFPDFKADLEWILAQNVRVALQYGDADYICNWLGGEAVSLAVEYEDSEAFRAAGYAPLLVDGTEYGVVRQYGNFSFTRLYDAGHETPYYQPVATLEFFRRVLGDLVLADGKSRITDDYQSEGPANATHTQPYPPLPDETGAAAGRKMRRGGTLRKEGSLLLE